MKKHIKQLPSAPGGLKELDLQQMQFVTAFLELGGRAQDGVPAALSAGYGDGSADDAKRCANILLAAPKITNALRSATVQRFDVAVVAAFTTLLDICSSKSAPANARIAAAQEILNRSSIGPIVSRSVGLRAQVGVCVEDFIAAADLHEREEAQHTKEAQGRVIDIVALSSTDEERAAVRHIRRQPRVDSASPPAITSE
jgi:phage terminase small subunit